MDRGRHDLERIFELSGEMLCVIDAEGRFERVSSGWEAQLGWAREELVGTRCVELLHPEDLERTLDDAAVVSQPEAELIAFENRYRHSDGSYR